MDEGGVLEIHDDRNHNYPENHGNVYYLNCSSPMPSEANCIPAAVDVCDCAENATHTDSASDSEVDCGAIITRSLTSNPSEFSKFVSFDLPVVPYAVANVQLTSVLVMCV